jgi:uncharacterized membrane protein
MSRATLQRIPLRANRFQGFGEKIHRVLFLGFVLQFLVVWLNLWMGVPDFGAARWPEGLLLVLSAGSLVSAATRHLPGQNLILASVIILTIGGFAHALGAITGIPFGPFVYTTRIGQVLFEPLPWAVPVIWLLAVFSSRGVARLIMRPWRKTRSYGFWVLGLTVALVLVFDLGLEPFATEVKHYWAWSPANAGIFWYRTPWVNFLGWAATATLMLAFATPSLINKKPVKHQPVDFYPLVIWVMVMSLFVTGSSVHHLWRAVIIEAVATAFVALFAIKGGMW